VPIGERALAVEAACDLLVVGASFAGVALAHAVARAGHRVVLVEPRTARID
jgi:2-polyprenyl-6-methoxyphenol hydroxylase-like FAD-dependent oxidoreductase